MHFNLPHRKITIIQHSPRRWRATTIAQVVRVRRKGRKTPLIDVVKHWRGWGRMIPIAAFIHTLIIVAVIAVVPVKIILWKKKYLSNDKFWRIG